MATTKRRKTARREREEKEEEDEECRDTDPEECREKQFLCGDHDYEERMHKRCPVTCKSCNGKGAEREREMKEHPPRGGGPLN